MQLKKNIKAGKIKLFTFSLIIFSLFVFSNSYSKNNNNLEGNYTDIKILDKISSKNELL